MGDVWDFLRKDRGFKVVVRQKAASVWNYDFVHRNVYRLAVEDPSYKRALERFAEREGWIFEVERHDDLRESFRYEEVDGLLVEIPECSIVNCVVDWSFLDAFAVLYFRRDELDLRRVRALGRWRRMSGTNVRAWSAIRYGCNLFNKRLEKEIFGVRETSLGRDDVEELVEEAVEKVVEFA